MKRFTVISMVLIVAIFVGLVVYVGNTEEFEPPLSAEIEASDTNSWSMSYEQLVAYLEGKGLIDSSTEQLLAESGLCSKAYKYNGAELYWWDLETLDKNSDEYKAFESLQKEGFINLYGMGLILSPVQNGPFALLLTYYEGDATALEEAFCAFGKKEEIDLTTGIWQMTLDDLAAYMVEQGAVTSEMERININFGSDSKGVSGYRYDGNIDIYFYDMSVLKDGDTEYEQYESIASTGMDVYWNGVVGYYTVNGPFMLHFYAWAEEPVQEEEQTRIREIFQAFGQE